MIPNTLLRQRTAASHAELESIPFAERLAAGTIDRLAYTDYLRATATLVASLRTGIRRHGAPMHRSFLDTLESWTHLLEADIRSVGCEDGLVNTGAQQAALDLVHKLRIQLLDEPAWVMGMVYVLFGSHNGNRFVAKAVTRGLSLAGDEGTGYLRATCYNRQLWPEFKDQIDRTLGDNELVDSAVNGALATFACFQRIFEALEHNEIRNPHASAINPEAGDHPVVTDEAFRAVAARAGTLCHNAFGYLVRRYGDRGQAFARSDGAWLGTLVELSEDEARRQVNWLARLLSARDIPSVCLEFHLNALHRDLEANDLLAGRERLFESLARDVASGYRTALDPETYGSLVDTAIPALDPRGAEILLGAVADQHAGLAPCADRITDWIESDAAFDEATRRDLHAFVNQAHAAIAP